MKSEKMREISHLNQEMDLLSKKRCNRFVCRTDEYTVSMELQDLADTRLELYYELINQ